MVAVLKAGGRSCGGSDRAVVCVGNGEGMIITGEQGVEVRSGDRKDLG